MADFCGFLFDCNNRTKRAGRSGALGEALLYHEIEDGKEDQGNDDPLDVVAIFEYLVVQLLFGDNGVKIPAEAARMMFQQPAPRVV